MKRQLITLLGAALLLATSMTSFGATTYDQTTVANYASAANIEKIITTAPNDLANFTNALLAAFSTNFGGNFHFPSTVASGTTVFRGLYGGGTKRLLLTSSTTMQNVTSSGSFVPVSSANGIASSTDVGGYNLAIGPAVDTNGISIPEAVVRLGFTVLSRTGGSYPLDVNATVSFSDGTSQSVTSAIGGTKGTDDTFFAFTAPAGATITNLALASFATGTTTPVNTRIGLDDIAFVAAWTVPPPQVLNVSPFNYAAIPASAGVQFDALAFLMPIETSGIWLILNGTDVSSQLSITGPSTNRHVTFSNLVPNQIYDMQIIVSNQVGSVSASSRFYTKESLFTLYDSGGFSDTALYPPGPGGLMAFTNNEAVFLPPVDAAEIIDTGEPAYGPALKETQMGNNQTTYVDVSPLASGIIRFSFDARVSTPYGRTLDMGLNVAGSGTQGSFLGWGVATNEFGTNTGSFCYYNGSAWVPLTNMDTGWHHYEMTNYISGPCAGSFEMAVDGVVVGHLLPFRNALPAQSPMGRLRLATMSGPALEFGIVDNLLIQGGPEVPGIAPRPQILNLSPGNYAVLKSTDSIQFDAFSYLPVDNSGVSLLVNSNDVSGQLVFSGNTTNRHVSYSGLAPNQVYDIQITVSNQAGTVSATSRFYSTSVAYTLADLCDFSDANLYPIGPLQPVASNGWAWLPPIDAAQVVDSGSPEHGSVLRQTQMGGADQYTYLTFPPVASSFVLVSFDVRVSTPFSRTLDVGVQSGGQQASLMAWGVITNQFGTNSGEIAYYNNGVWSPMAAVDGEWHHIEILNYCAGSKLAKYDVALDGKVVGKSLPWREAITAPLNRVRFATIRGETGTYAEVDNIVVLAGPAVTTPAAVSMNKPVSSGTAFNVSFPSQFGVLYNLQTINALNAGTWTNTAAVIGDGTLKTFSESNLSGPKFFRLQAQ